MLLHLFAAPEIAAGAVAVATYSALTGAVIGAATVGNDIYDAVTTLRNPNATTNQITAGFIQTGADVYNTFLNVEGIGRLESAALSVGTAAQTVMQSIYSPTLSDAALAASGFVASAGAYAFNDFVSTDAATTSSIQNAYDTALPNGLNSVCNALIRQRFARRTPQHVRANP